MNIKVLSAIVLVPLTVAGCTKSSMSPDSGEEAKEYTVTLACGGEIKDVTVSDLTKADENNDLYGVQVYSRPAQSENEYMPYAYGLFDTMEGRGIKLLEGYEYKFVATMVKDGKKILATVGSNASNAFRCPFGLYPTNKTAYISTSFIYDSEHYFYDSGNGRATLNPDEYTLKHPNTDRYYGEVEGFIPSESSKVTISMKRTVFGLKVKTENLSEGSLNIAMKEAPSMAIASPDTEVQDIFTFDKVRDAWATDNYKESIDIAFTWTKADGVVVPIATKTFDFYRNKLTTITVKVSNRSEDSGVGVEIEDSQMTDGDSYTIETE